MLQTSFPTPAVPRSAGSAAAAMLLGAGMACAGTAQASNLPQPDALDASALPSQAASSARNENNNPLAAARGSMAGWKPVAHDKLDEMRGGYEVPGLQVSFGIERAVYINGALVVATSITIPDVSRITADQAAQLASALGPAIVASTNAAVNNALAGNPVTAGTQVGADGANASASTGSAGAAASAGGTAGASGAATAVAANGGASSGTGAAGAAGAGVPGTTVTTATGQVLTNGLLNVIQNGPGNAASVGALAGTPATVIQNTLNNQSIRSLMTIDASVNTLQAFRSQLANTTLNNALLRAASMR